MQSSDIILNFNKLINLFEYKFEESKKVEYKLNLIYVNIINTIKNNESMFKNKAINNNEFNNNLKDLDKISKTLINLKESNFISNENYYQLNLDIDSLINDIIEFNKKISSSKINDILILHDIHWRDNITKNLLNKLNFYDNIFTCFNFTFSNNSDTENGIKFKKVVSKNADIIDDIHGANLIINFNNKSLTLNGYFINDTINIIKNDKFFKKKTFLVKQLLKNEVIPDKFKNDYFNQLTLRNFVVHSPNEILNIINDGYSKHIFYKSLSLSSLLHTFSTANFEKQRDILTILIISDLKSASLASLLYDILLQKNDIMNAKQLYLTLHISVQKIFDVVFDDFNKNIKKIKKLTLDDVSYEKRICLLDTSDLNKSKAIDKLKLMNNGGLFGNSDNKCQLWLDGFIKIPFNLFKTNKIFDFVTSYKIILKNFVENLKDVNEELYNILIKYQYPETDYEIDLYLQNINNYFDKYLEIVDNLEIKDKIYIDFHNIMNNWNTYILDRKNYIKNVRNTLNNCVYGNEKSKKSIETIIAQWISGKDEGSIIGFNGPPGVGKTTIAKKGISKCLIDDNNETRPFAFIPLGGSSNGSDTNYGIKMEKRSELTD